VLERTDATWSEFRDHLAAAIAAHTPSPGESAATAYYTAWLDAVEALLAGRGLVLADAVWSRPQSSEVAEAPSRARRP
jgi:hypothetical protein